MDNTVAHDAWLVTISGFLLSLPFVLSYAFLARRFPDKNIVEINEAVYGGVLGRVISALYVFFILYLVSLNLRIFSDFYTGNILPETPPMVILSVFMVCVAAVSVRMGIDAIAKTGVIIAVVILITEALTLLLLISDMDFSNLLPVMNQPAPVYAHTTFVMAAIPYCELFIFMTVFPQIADKRRIGRLTVMGLAASALLFLVITLRNTVVLDASESIYAITSFQSVRMINIGEFLTRVELLMALGLTLSLFYKISVLFYAASLSISSALRLKTYNPVLMPLAAITVVYAVVVHESTVSHTFIASRYHVVLTLPFEFILPPLTLLIAKLRRLPGGQNKPAGHSLIAGRPQNG
jgi:spore germination protein KB